MRARVVAPLVAALIGIAGGSVTAVVLDDEQAAPDRPAAITDPLGLGIPLVRLACNPAQGVIVLGFGDTAPALRTAIKDNPAGDPSYLETADSCDTIYGPERKKEPPTYAVVLGPYDDLIEPCRLRMDPVRRGDFVTALRSGNAMSVKCVCVLPDSADRPDLRVGMTPTEENRVWIRSLQGMFNDFDEESFPRDWVTGIYDQRTADRVREFQETSFVDDEPGTVDDATWQLLTTRMCGRYDF